MPKRGVADSICAACRSPSSTKLAKGSSISSPSAHANDTGRKFAQICGRGGCSATFNFSTRAAPLGPMAAQARLGRRPSPPTSSFRPLLALSEWLIDLKQFWRK